MCLEEIKNELNELEVNDLNSAIKGEVLEELQCTLENNQNSKIQFTTVNNVNDIVEELNEIVVETISNHLMYCFDLTSKDKEDICL